MSNKQQEQLGAGMSATRTKSNKRSDEQAQAIGRSSEYLRAKEELGRIYNDFGRRLVETLKPLGVTVVRVHIHSTVPKNVRELSKKLAALRIVPEAKADAAKTKDEFPSWLEGNWCEK